MGLREQPAGYAPTILASDSSHLFASRSHATCSTAAPPEPEHRRALLSTVLARSKDRRLALAIVLLSTVLFVAAVPFVRVPLAKLPAFIPTYEAALAINDLITAVLLFGQFTRLRSRALLTLASGYLFCALIIIPHALTFPNAFSPSGLLGAGSQTTAWLFVFWHAGFPLFVLAYAIFRRRHPGADRLHGYSRAAIPLAIICVAGAVVGVTLLSTWGMDLLPLLIQGGDYSLLITSGASPAILVLCFLALAFLWRQRRPTVLDVWLMVVMCASILDVALSAVISSARFDLGWYAGRSYGLLAASFVLIVLLLETNGLHLRLARAQTQLSNRARDLERRVHERTDELLRSNETLRKEVSDRKQAEQKLLPMQAFLDGIIESIPAMLLVKDARDGKCLLLNRAGEELLGCNREEVIGKNVQDIMPMEQKKATKGEQPSGHALGTHQVDEHTLVTRKQGARLVRTKRVLLTDEHGQSKYKLRFTEDITEQRQTQDQLRQAQKMEAMGQLTGGLAHDFNNLLAVIVGNLDLLKEGTGDPAKEVLLQDALGAALSGAELTRRLLAFARQQPLQPEPIDLNELVGDISKLLARTLGGNVGIKLDLDQSIAPVVVDRVQLETALTNLANNARDAMPYGGKLLIATRNAYLDEDYSAQHDEVESGSYVAIEVTDTGEGMPPERLERIFEPFFTTKGLGKGTGLGLSMVFGFIKQSGGHINVYSEPGRGSTFRLFLRPVESISVMVGRSIEAPPLRPTRGAGETILVVEDNLKLREVVVKQLTESGFDVIHVGSAQEALDILEKRGDIDLLFTDVVLPGEMDGYVLAREVAGRHPRSKILLTSGFPGRRLTDEEPLKMGIRLLSKPYRREELIRTMLELLEGSSSSTGGFPA